MRKRKERDDGSEPLGFKPPTPAPTAFKPPPRRLTKAPPAAVPSNRLLACYMAYEFITKGTLLGQEWGSAHESKRAEPVKEEQYKYGEVTRILKTEGAHIPGIVNPTQLARWIQM